MRELLETDQVILNHGQVTKTPEQIPHTPNFHITLMAIDENRCVLIWSAKGRKMREQCGRDVPKSIPVIQMIDREGMVVRRAVAIPIMKSNSSSRLKIGLGGREFGMWRGR
ncbi:hypothetical protein TNCV_2597771 [Trichonephila clavipes]|nr:hypothetical protein TNCV_2597771 [Trichonephila clavipes]